MTETAIKLAVRNRYAQAAQGNCCGGTSCCETGIAAEDLSLHIPSLGCGTPVDAAELQPGEVVLDLGSGRGLDAFRAAQRVGTGGRVVGVDMTPEMVWRAREDARRLGFAQVEFRLAEIEALPLADASVDVVISNCVINLVPDKARAFAEAYRVLRPGGRLVVSDIVRTRPRKTAATTDLKRWAACVEGAEEESSYLERIRRAGFTRVEIMGRGQGENGLRRSAHRVFGLASLTVRAHKPGRELA